MIAYSVTGEGEEPVLLLNGGLMTMAAWQPIVSVLEPSYRVVRCDFRGQLLSPGEPEPRLEAHVADVIEVLDSLRVERAHVVGVSFGGLVGLLLAALYPERVISLAAVTTTDRITEETREATASVREDALAAAAGGDGARVFDRIVPPMYTEAWREAQKVALGFQRQWVAALPPVWFRGVAGILAALEAADPEPYLPRIQAPALVVAAELDETFPLERSRALASAIPGARLEVVPGVGHGLIIERSRDLARILHGFLAAAA
jgi:3-oxoadipate enol-lactonase